MINSSTWYPSAILWDLREKCPMMRFVLKSTTKSTRYLHFFFSKHWINIEFGKKKKVSDIQNACCWKMSTERSVFQKTGLEFKMHSYKYKVTVSVLCDIHYLLWLRKTLHCNCRLNNNILTCSLIFECKPSHMSSVIWQDAEPRVAPRGQM